MPLAVIYIAAAMLIFGAAPMPYGYYTLLRLVATIVFAWAAFETYGRKKQYLPWIFGLLALLFNPFVKIYLPKEIWAFIDIGAGFLLLMTKQNIYKMKKEKYN
ncbi:DUF6804 family protein [Halomonas aestuarii]|uniref:DUF6804 family protein n=1 Tax=Halomonas aestuarii TaxID=1897729 RepID=UPI0009038017|nr:DUF6804 family protein [Halomonas aestuarii]